MYNELYENWKRELENIELEKLPSDFYSKITDYLRKLREESRMLDKRTAKANLLEKEMRNAKRMIREMVQARYRKLVKKAVKSERIPSEALTAEEERIYKGILPLAEAFHSFMNDVLRGHVPKADFEKEHKGTVLRFLKDVPAIIGADMKTYGPFTAEDVASLPVENSKILVKKGLAEKVETS